MIFLQSDAIVISFSCIAYVALLYIQTTQLKMEAERYQQESVAANAKVEKLTAEYNRFQELSNHQRKQIEDQRFRIGELERELKRSHDDEVPATTLSSSVSLNSFSAVVVTPAVHLSGSTSLNSCHATVAHAGHLSGPASFASFGTPVTQTGQHTGRSLAVWVYMQLRLVFS